MDNSLLGFGTYHVQRLLRDVTPGVVFLLLLGLQVWGTDIAPFWRDEEGDLGVAWAVLLLAAGIPVGMIVNSVSYFGLESQNRLLSEAWLRGRGSASLHVEFGGAAAGWFEKAQRGPSATRALGGAVDTWPPISMGSFCRRVGNVLSQMREPSPGVVRVQTVASVAIMCRGLALTFFLFALTSLLSSLFSPNGNEWTLYRIGMGSVLLALGAMVLSWRVDVGRWREMDEWGWDRLAVRWLLSCALVLALVYVLLSVKESRPASEILFAWMALLSVVFMLLSAALTGYSYLTSLEQASHLEPRFFDLGPREALNRLDRRFARRNDAGGETRA